MAMLSLPLHVISERCSEGDKPLAKVPPSKVGLDADGEALAPPEERETHVGLYDHAGRPMGGAPKPASKEDLFKTKKMDSRIGYAPVIVELPSRCGMVFSNTDNAVDFMEESGWAGEAILGQYYLLPITSQQELRALMSFFTDEEVVSFVLDPVPGESGSLYTVDTLPKMMYLPG